MQIQYCILVIAAPMAASGALAEVDKNGVAPTVVSRPAGPGSLEGLGDAFQPALNNGTAQYRVGLTLPRGVAGFTPGVALRYEGGDGFSELGVGWSLGVGCVRRQVDEGLPRYGQAPDGETLPDRFLGMEGEELVPLANGYYLAKVERLYIRYRFNGSYWEGTTKSGVRLEFGRTSQSRLTSADGSQVYAWHLERQTDTHGNVIEYHYILPNTQDRRIYLGEIDYGPGAPPWSHSYRVVFTYESRPDSFTDCRAGFAVRTSRRLRQIDVLYDELLIRRHVIGYEADNLTSLLSSITTYGADGVSALPVTRFGYSLFHAGDGSSPISAANAIVASRGEPPQALDGGDSELIDLNADALPDLLVTGAGHQAYLNRGVQGGASDLYTHWEGPIAVAADEERALAYDLSSTRVHLADMTGDGIADLVTADDNGEVEYFANTGRVGWAAGAPMSSEHRAPPSPFGNGSSKVRTLDLSFNKRMGIMQSDQGALLSWYNQGDGRYTGPRLTDAPYDGSRPVELSDRGVYLADMNGDRILDIVKVTPYSVVSWPGLGYGRFGARHEMLLPDRALDDRPGGNLDRARLEDLTGDGLADLVVEQAEGADLWFWRNLGDDRLQTSRVVTDLPVTPHATAHWADLNGNGTIDLAYSDSTLPTSKIHFVDLGALIGGADHYNLLVSVDNGCGRRTSIAYRTTTDYAVTAQQLGNPWTTSAPFPVHVVSETRTAIGLDLDGFSDEGPNGDEYVTQFHYRNGYYDPIEHQFRGFDFVKQFDVGDERFGGADAPTLVVRYAFHTGAPDGVDNDNDGQIDEEGDIWTGREEEPLKGVLLWRETASLPDDSFRDGQFASDAQVFERKQQKWEVRDLCRGDGGAVPDLLGEGYHTQDAYHRDVRQAVSTQDDRIILEQQRGAAVTIRSISDLDALGEIRFKLDEGDVSNPDDDMYTRYEYARNEPAWIMDRISRARQSATPEDGPFVGETRNYYDGAAFVGLPLGQVGASGDLHRSEKLISDGDVPPLEQRSFNIGDPRNPRGAVDTLRRELDSFGNATTIRDANNNDRRFAFDLDMHTYPISETMIMGNGQADLSVSADYDPRFGAIIQYIDFNGLVTQFTYDTFGRLDKELRPGDPIGSPSRKYIYDLAAPVSSIRTVLRDNVRRGPNVSTRVFFDGLGRRLGVFETGGPVMSAVTLYNPRGLISRVFEPYAGGDGSWRLPPDGAASSSTRYDAAGRTVESHTPPNNVGQIARTTKVYLPLSTVIYDPEDNAAGPHADTPTTLIEDGLGRRVEVRQVEGLSQSDSGTFATRYRYALPARLAEIEDAKGNIKYMRYDGLGRRIFMNDVDAGHITYTYDALDNLVEKTDALDQVTTCSYDAAGRLLTVDYLDDDHPLSLHRTPDIAYHYDLPHPEFPALANQKGRLSWVDDLSGREFTGYDAFGDVDTTVKRINQADGTSRDFVTRVLWDNLNRAVQMTYPDGGTVTYEYDARGLPASVPGFVNQWAYTAARRPSACSLANGAVTGYRYDPRQRLVQLTTQSGGEVLQDLSYELDEADNVLAISDGRGLLPDDPRSQSASYCVDDRYQLIEAQSAAYGTIQYDYDRLGNMVRQTSADIPDEDVVLGAMTMGGSGGTSGRIGREAGDPPGPHALTRTDNGQRRRKFNYDDNGDMVSNDGDDYIYDYADHLGQVARDGLQARYYYDHTGRRVIKRLGDDQTSYIDGASEWRGGRLLKYVFWGNERKARVEGPMPAPAGVVQRMDLAKGWNLISFQVDPGTSAPQTVLASIDQLYTAVYGYSGGVYTRYIPGAGDNTLTTLRPNEGYWIRMSASAPLSIEGPVSTAQVHVSAGVSALVGFPGLATRGRDDLDREAPDLVSLWAYDGAPAEWRVFHASAPAYINTLEQTEPGRGYWMTSSTDATLTPPAPGAVHYYHADHLGSANLITDSAGQRVSEFYNYPFGLPRHEHHEGDPFDPLYQFSDKERDAESGLHDFGARFYASLVGRFTRVDPFRVAQFDLENPAKLNVYAYALNRPLVLIDSSGLEPTESDDDDETSTGDQIAEDTVAVVEAGTDVTKVAEKAKEKLTAKAAEQLPASQSPDSQTRADAGAAVEDAIPGAIGESAADLGVSKFKDVASTPVLVGTGVGYAGLAYGLAAADEGDLPLPIPGIPLDTGGSGTFELKPQVDLGPVTASTEGAEQFVPTLGLGLTYSSGPLSQSFTGVINPVEGPSASYGLTYHSGPVSITTSASASAKEAKGSFTLSIAPF